MSNAQVSIHAYLKMELSAFIQQLDANRFGAHCCCSIHGTTYIVKRRSHENFFILLFHSFVLFYIVGCGGTKAPSRISISIQPKLGELTLAQTQGFTATASGIDGSRLRWQSDFGTILQPNGVSTIFQAPDDPGVATITAYYLDDYSVEDKTIIKIIKPNRFDINVLPNNPSLYPMQSLDFNAAADGTFLQKFIWHLDMGTFQTLSPSSIRWTAPALPGKYDITAQWVADPIVIRTITASVLAPPLVLILTPSETTVSVTQVVPLYLQISTNEIPGVDTSVTWSSDGGTLIVGDGGQGFFNSILPGNYRVTVISNSYPTVQSTSVIIVQ